MRVSSVKTVEYMHFIVFLLFWRYSIFSTFEHFGLFLNDTNSCFSIRFQVCSLWDFSLKQTKPKEESK